jgi:hypothetical protein
MIFRIGQRHKEPDRKEVGFLEIREKIHFYTLSYTFIRSFKVIHSLFSLVVTAGNAE